AGAVRLGRAGPIEREHVASVVPLPILKDRADAAVGEPVEGVDADVGAEAVPQLEVVERDLRRIQLVHERVDRHPPDDRAALGHDVEPDRIPWSRGDAKDHDALELAVAALLVVEKFLADQALPPRNVSVQVHKTLPLLRAYVPRAPRGVPTPPGHGP